LLQIVIPAGQLHLPDVASQLVLVGALPELGAWDVARGVRFEQGGQDFLSMDLCLPANTPISCKVRKLQGNPTGKLVNPLAWLKTLKPPGMPACMQLVLRRHGQPQWEPLPGDRTLMLGAAAPASAPGQVLGAPRHMGFLAL
jgi:hypothetical protein